MPQTPASRFLNVFIKKLAILDCKILSPSPNASEAYLRYCVSQTPCTPSRKFRDGGCICALLGMLEYSSLASVLIARAALLHSRASCPHCAAPPGALSPVRD